jgi:hypothetical protein
MALVLAVRPQDVERSLDLAAGPAEVESRPQRATPVDVRLEPAANRHVEFTVDIQPLLTRSCVGCHGDQDPESSFSLTSRQSLLRGGDSELPAIVPGASQDSPLVRYAASLVEQMEMPPLDKRSEYPAFSAAEIALLRAWIDQGAVWPEAESPTGQ